MWKEVIFFTLGFIVVFGGISFIWNKFEDWWDGVSSEKPFRKTGKTIKVSGKTLVEYEIAGDSQRTVYKLDKK